VLRLSLLLLFVLLVVGGGIDGGDILRERDSTRRKCVLPDENEDDIDNWRSDRWGDGSTNAAASTDGIAIGISISHDETSL
jgi:hypothetical protein